MSKRMIGAVVAVALGASSIASSAYAAPVANPASSLSLGSVSRAGAPSGHNSKLAGAGGGAILGALIAIGVAAIIIVVAVRDDHPASN